ncbi:carboxypeptidase-like regulatory domain-containing protein [Tepidibacter hydrothermalis]|uniref:Carboxypeptidase-like regulatory domain-containing protein n=1 Tax=Tepidibacter hydrothermalis TaxID=3036126 RepID=A0ABY8EIV4_9FIRM|nr:carboxypeptidase-like regulatory domain-containing protein [Tepidibacter hydrothermalis]WFD10890.1 carboxypeptidase-like regulatory domain-containing protein [Tepidibacter hydrothermalis]
MDKYILGQSKIANITKDSPEVVLSLQLKKNAYYNNTLIYGYITDLDGKPIENANVIFLNKNNEEIGSIYSSKEGLYTYFGVIYNSIVKIIVKKSGYKSNISDLLKICLKKFVTVQLLKNFDSCFIVQRIPQVIPVVQKSL